MKTMIVLFIMTVGICGIGALIQYSTQSKQKKQNNTKVEKYESKQEKIAQINNLIDRAKYQ